MPGGSLFSDEFRNRNEAALSSIETGPSAEELVAGQAGRLGLAQTSATPDATGTPGMGAPPLGGPPDTSIGIGHQIAHGIGLAGRVIGGVASLGLSEAVMHAARINTARHQVVADQIRAQTRMANMQSIEKTLDIASEITKNIAAIQDPEKQKQLVEQTIAGLSQETPAIAGLVRAMVQSNLLAFVDRKDRLATAAGTSPTLQSVLADPIADPAKLPESVQIQALREVQSGLALKSLPTVRPMVSRMLKWAADQGIETRSKSEIPVSEAIALGQRFRSQDPAFNDPAQFEAFRGVMIGLGSSSLGFKSDEMTAFEQKEQIKAKYAKPGVVVNLNEGKNQVYDQVLKDTGNPKLAVAAVQGKAYQDPILDEWVMGSDVDRRKAEGRRAFLSAVEELRQSAGKVAAAYPDTNRLDEVVNQIKAGVGAGDPIITGYESTRKRSAAALRMSETGQQASEQELQRIIGEFPPARSIAQGGRVSTTALNQIGTLEKNVLNAYTASFPPERAQEIGSRLDQYLARERGRLGAPRGAGQPGQPATAGAAAPGDLRAVVERVESELQQQLGRQPTAQEIAGAVQKASQGTPGGP